MIAGLIVAAALMVWTSPVSAHSFLVDTQPSQGERLTSSPSEVVFRFTEAVVTDRVEIAVNTADEANGDIGSPEAEIAFAVGEAGSLPTATSSAAAGVGGQ